MRGLFDHEAEVLVTVGMNELAVVGMPIYAELTGLLERFSASKSASNASLNESFSPNWWVVTE